MTLQSDHRTTALREIVRVVDGHDRGEPFGDEEVGSLPLLPYIADVARAALDEERSE
jgi:hypothetical protein